MKWSKWLENWNMTSLKITAPFLEMEWSPSEPDKAAAWELYIELITRTTTQPLEKDEGDEDVALSSVYSIFPITRSIIKSHGRECIEFTKLSIIVLNQIVRPFTAKWHKISLDNGFDDPEICLKFREELCGIQESLITYSSMLADMAGVEDLVNLEG